MHTKNPGYQAGNHWTQCDECGFDYRVSEMRRRWDNAVVCRKCFELRHPQDFVRGIKDDSAAKGYVRVQNDDDTAVVCNAQGVDSRVGNGIAGCLVVGLEVEF